MNAKTEQKARSRAAILDASARLLRERGIVGAKVADVMAGAGLTVGGFYAHFASKEALVDQTLADTARHMRERLFARLDQKPEADRAEVVLKRYLTTANRDDVREGCPFPAIAGEIATTAPEHGEALAAQVEAMADGLKELVPERAGISAKHLALGLTAMMVGGLTLARATRGTELSDELLKACRALGRVALGRTP